VVLVDRVAVGEQGGAFDQVAQLADVAAVAAAGQPSERCRGEMAPGLTVDALQ